MNVVVKDPKNKKRYQVSDADVTDGKGKLKKHDGKNFAQLTAQQKDELLLALLQLMGLADKNGVLRVK